MGVGKALTSAFPGGRPGMASDEWLEPVFKPIMQVSGEWHESDSTETSSTKTIDKATGAKKDNLKRTKIITYRFVLDYKEQLDEVIEHHTEDVVGTTPEYMQSRFQTQSMYYHYTPLYAWALFNYDLYRSSRSCYNANVNDDPTSALPPVVFSLMQWQNFPFSEITEEVHYFYGEISKGPPPVSGVLADVERNRLTIKSYIYDLINGIQIAETQHSYEFAVKNGVNPKTVQFINGAAGDKTLFDKYAQIRSMGFGEAVTAPENSDFWIALRSITTTSYTPLTLRTTRIDKSVVTNRNVLFPTVKESGEVVEPEPQMATTVETVVQNGGPPRLAKQNLPDYQARLGRLSGGDLAAQLTARKMGSPITSNLVAFVAAGAQDGGYQVIAENLFYIYGGLQDISELRSMTNDVFSEVNSADTILYRKVAAATNTKLARVAMVLALYKIQYDSQDAAELSGYIDNYMEIIAAYELEIQLYLDLIACQRGFQISIVQDIWARRQIDSVTAINKWLELQRLENLGVTQVSPSAAGKMYDMYIDFRRKISVQDALRAVYQHDKKLENYTQLSIATLQYTEEMVIGDRLSLSSIRDSFDASVASVSLSISPTAITGTVDLRIGGLS